MRKHPMKVNVYDFMRTANSALAPMFPYQDPGAIVPCVTAFRGAQDRTFGAFQHFNTVDEVMINFGSHGAAPRPGMVAVGAQLHQVSIRMTDPNDDNACQLNVITQRQSEVGEEQHERVTFFCVKCQASLVEHAYMAQPSEELRNRFTAGETGPLGTLIESARTAEEYNADDDARKCAQCGHVNEAFPLDNWGWSKYVESSLTAADTYRSFTSAYTPEEKK